MTVTVSLIKEHDAAWDAYVASHPEATNYHRYGWKEVVEKSFGHQGLLLAAKDRDGAIHGVLPLVSINSALFGRSMVSVPFFNYGGLLCDDTLAEKALLDEAQRIRQKLGARHVELRHLKNYPGLATKSHKVTMILSLEGDEAGQWKVLDAKVRNQVRKAEKSGLEVVTGQLELLEGFYQVFCRNMRDLGTPVYGREFFRNILLTFHDSTRVLSITYQGKTVASAILTWFRDTLEVPWASSIQDYRSFCPNNLLYWEAIRSAIAMGMKRFDFGRSTPDEGTYRFKKQWGAKPAPLYWQYLIDAGVQLPELSPANSKYRLAIRLWQRLPVAVTKILGPRIVRCIP